MEHLRPPNVSARLFPFELCPTYVILARLNVRELSLRLLLSPRAFVPPLSISSAPVLARIIATGVTI